MELEKQCPTATCTLYAKLSTAGNDFCSPSSVVHDHMSASAGIEPILAGGWLEKSGELRRRRQK